MSIGRAAITGAINTGQVHSNNPSSTAVTHSSDDVFSLGTTLIAYIEKRLEYTLKQTVGWRHMYHTRRGQTTPSEELHHVFELHSQYMHLNMKRQKALITDVEVASRSFIISELSVIESQKQTVERLMGTYTAAVFAQQSELANFKANTLAIVGVIVAITAFIITDLRFQSLLK
jgi:hypothetical protein